MKYDSSVHVEARLSCCFTLNPDCVQMWGCVEDAVSSPDVESFLSSVNQITSNLRSARDNVETKFELQQVDLPDTIQQLKAPGDYTAAGRRSAEGVSLTSSWRERHMCHIFDFMLAWLSSYSRTLFNPSLVAELQL